MATPTGISKRSDGRWSVKYQGRQTTCKTEAEAKRKLKEMKAMQKMEANIGRFTVEYAVTHWLTVKRTQVKPSSYDMLERVWQTYIKDNIGEYQFSAVTAYDVEKILFDLSERNYSKATINAVYSFLKCCFQYYYQKGEIPNNPAMNAEIPTGVHKPRGEIVFYTDEELERIYGSATSTHSTGRLRYPQGWAVVLLGNTGMRMCELSGLRWENVDFKKKIIHVRETRVYTRDRSPDAQYKYKMTPQSSTKTTNGQRDIPINERALVALQNLHATGNGCEYVLASTSGKPLGAHSFDSTFRKILENAGIPKDKVYGVHALRHSFATNLIRNKVPVKVVSKLLGHGDIAITLKTYTHVLPEDYADAVATLD